MKPQSAGNKYWSGTVSKSSPRSKMSSQLEQRVVPHDLRPTYDLASSGASPGCRRHTCMRCRAGSERGKSLCHHSFVQHPRAGVHTAQVGLRMEASQRACLTMGCKPCSAPQRHPTSTHRLQVCFVLSTRADMPPVLVVDPNAMRQPLDNHLLRVTSQFQLRSRIRQSPPTPTRSR